MPSGPLTGPGTEVEITPGDFTLSAPEELHDSREVTHLYNRESHLEAVRGRVKQLELSIEIHQDGPTYSAASSTVMDFILGHWVTLRIHHSGSRRLDPGDPS